MKILHDITQFVTRLEHNFVMEDEATMLAKLYTGIHEGRYSNESEAAHDLYEHPEGAAFRKLKERYRKKMASQIIRHDLTRKFSTKYSRAIYETMCNVQAGQVLLMKGQANAAREIFKSTLKTAQRFQLTETELICLKVLRYRSALAGNKEKLNNYENQLVSVQKRLNAEIELEGLSHQLTCAAVNSVNPDEHISIAEISYRKGKQIIESHNSYSLRLTHYRISIRYFNLLARYKEVLKVCDKALVYFESIPHIVTNERKGEFSLQKLAASLNLQDYSNGTKYLALCQQYIESKSPNWLVALEFYFLLCMHTGNYLQALDVFYQATEHRFFNKMGKVRKEKWKLFEAYLNFALPEDLPKKEFRLFSFLNDVPIYTRDKRGYNLSIIFAEVLLLANMGDFDKLIDRTESINAYFRKYVRKEQSPRSYYFGKMLQALLRYDFDVEKTETIARKFLTRIQAISDDPEQQVLDGLEIIPYHKLWPMLLQKIKLHSKLRVIPH